MHITKDQVSNAKAETLPLFSIDHNRVAQDPNCINAYHMGLLNIAKEYIYKYLTTRDDNSMRHISFLFQLIFSVTVVESGFLEYVKLYDNTNTELITPLTFVFRKLGYDGIYSNDASSEDLCFQSV